MRHNPVGRQGLPASAAPAIALAILLLALRFVRPTQMVFRLDGREAAEWWYNAPGVGP